MFNVFALLLNDALLKNKKSKQETDQTVLKRSPKLLIARVEPKKVEGHDKNVQRFAPNVCQLSNSFRRH